MKGERDGAPSLISGSFPSASLTENTKVTSLPREVGEGVIVAPGSISGGVPSPSDETHRPTSKLQTSPLGQSPGPSQETNASVGVSATSLGIRVMSTICGAWARIGYRSPGMMWFTPVDRRVYQYQPQYPSPAHSGKLKHATLASSSTVAEFNCWGTQVATVSGAMVQ